jgi:tetratricopeptide (TPR) repeat protein
MNGSASRKRLVGAGLLVLGFGGLAAAHYRSAGSEDRQRAATLIQNALDDLHAPGTASSTVDAYAAQLARADGELCVALARYPLDSLSMQRLAAIRWEGGVLRGGDEGRSALALADIAATRAPRDPNVQAAIGALLLRMAQPDRASAFMTRSVAMLPSMTNRVVSSMLETGNDPDDVVTALGATPLVLIATKDGYLQRGQGSRFLELVEQHLGAAPALLLETYGDACLELHVPERLRDRIGSLAPSADTAIGAYRNMQTARAWYASGDLSAAARYAQDACATLPEDARTWELNGTVSLADIRFTDAEKAFRAALDRVVVSGGDAKRRSRVYTEIGMSLERQGRGDVAYDAFRRAVELDPDAREASNRIASYQRTIGRPGAE